jgi:hypothetical protein
MGEERKRVDAENKKGRKRRKKEGRKEEDEERKKGGGRRRVMNSPARDDPPHGVEVLPFNLNCKQKVPTKVKQKEKLK